MRRTALLATLLAALSTAAWAQTPERPKPEPQDPAAMPEQAARQMLEALQLFLHSIPQYEMPEMLPNGDIIIRRINPPAPEPEATEPPAETPDSPAIDRT